jgi:hypothetical protein
VPTAKRERLPPHPPHPFAVPLLDKKKKCKQKVCVPVDKARPEKERRREGEKERRREGEKEREFIDCFHRALVEP